MPEPHTIAIAAGGTGGHRQIGLALAEAVRREWTTAEVILITSHSNSKWVADGESRFPCLVVTSSPFTGQSRRRQLLSLWQLGTGVLRLRQQLASHKVSMVIGCGGYASAAAVVAAASRGLPTVLHEANAVAGRANRLLARIARRTCLSWPHAAAQLGPAVLTGTPIRQAHREAAQRLRPGGERNTVLVLGGSLGAPLLNERVPGLLAALLAERRGFRVVHQCGEHPVQPIMEQYLEGGLAAEVVRFLPNPVQVYCAARIAISSAGASTLAELAAHGVPALLIPLHDAADDHQRANAEAYRDAVGMPWVDGDDLHDVSMHELLRPYLRDEALWSRAASRLRDFARTDAGAAIVAECRQLLEPTRA